MGRGCQEFKCAILAFRKRPEPSKKNGHRPDFVPAMPVQASKLRGRQAEGQKPTTSTFASTATAFAKPEKRRPCPVGQDDCPVRTGARELAPLACLVSRPLRIGTLGRPRPRPRSTMRRSCEILPGRSRRRPLYETVWIANLMLERIYKWNLCRSGDGTPAKAKLIQQASQKHLPRAGRGRANCTPLGTFGIKMDRMSALLESGHSRLVSYPTTTRDDKGR